MNLKEYVAETLVQIIEGVADAQKRTTGYGAKINPLARLYHPGETVSQETGESVRVVNFDMAVSAGKKEGASGGLKVWPFTAEGNLGSTSSEVSRVKFSVYVVLPPDPSVRA